LIFSIFRELQRIENATNSPVISHLSETIQGVTTIRAFNQQTRFTEILFKRLEANTIAYALLNTSHRWLGVSLVSTKNLNQNLCLKDDLKICSFKYSCCLKMIRSWNAAFL